VALLSEIACGIFVLVITVWEAVKLYRLRFKYFSEVWNVLFVSTRDKAAVSLRGVERAVCLDQRQRLPSVSEAWNVLFVSTRDKAAVSLRGVERAVCLDQ